MKRGDQERNKQVRKLQERIEELEAEKLELEEDNKRKQQSLNRVLHPERRSY